MIQKICLKFFCTNFWYDFFCLIFGLLISIEAILRLIIILLWIIALWWIIILWWIIVLWWINPSSGMCNCIWLIVWLRIHRLTIDVHCKSNIAARLRFKVNDRISIVDSARFDHCKSTRTICCLVSQHDTCNWWVQIASLNHEFKNKI